ncbi:hypothetical protein HX035_24555 [Escherichia coli]|nr:hypothetical protein [Escherichia coli]
MDELIKGMRDLKLKMSRIEEKGLPLGQATMQRPQSKEGFTYRCMWCDDPNHNRYGCDSLKAAVKENLVFFKDGMIHSKETGNLLPTNYGKGGMKKIAEEM